MESPDIFSTEDIIITLCTQEESSMHGSSFWLQEIICIGHLLLSSGKNKNKCQK